MHTQQVERSEFSFKSKPRSSPTARRISVGDRPNQQTSNEILETVGNFRKKQFESPNISKISIESDTNYEERCKRLSKIIVDLQQKVFSVESLSWELTLKNTERQHLQQKLAAFSKQNSEGKSIKKYQTAEEQQKRVTKKYEEEIAALHKQQEAAQAKHDRTIKQLLAAIQAVNWKAGRLDSPTSSVTSQRSFRSVRTTQDRNKAILRLREEIHQNKLKLIEVKFVNQNLRLEASKRKINMRSSPMQPTQQFEAQKQKYLRDRITKLERDVSSLTEREQRLWRNKLIEAEVDRKTENELRYQTSASVLRKGRIAKIQKSLNEAQQTERRVTASINPQDLINSRINSKKQQLRQLTNQSKLLQLQLIRSRNHLSVASTQQNEAYLIEQIQWSILADKQELQHIKKQISYLVVYLNQNRKDKQTISTEEIVDDESTNYEELMKKLRSYRELSDLQMNAERNRLTSQIQQKKITTLKLLKMNKELLSQSQTRHKVMNDTGLHSITQKTDQSYTITDAGDLRRHRKLGDLIDKQVLNKDAGGFNLKCVLLTSFLYLQIFYFLYVIIFQ